MALSPTFNLANLLENIDSFTIFGKGVDKDSLKDALASFKDSFPGITEGIDTSTVETVIDSSEFGELVDVFNNDPSSLPDFIDTDNFSTLAESFVGTVNDVVPQIAEVASEMNADQISEVFNFLRDKVEEGDMVTGDAWIVHLNNAEVEEISTVLENLDFGDMMDIEFTPAPFDEDEVQEILDGTDFISDVRVMPEETDKDFLVSTPIGKGEQTLEEALRKGENSDLADWVMENLDNLDLSDLNISDIA